MNPLNYNFVVKLSAVGRRPQVPTRFAVHKRPTQRVGPKVSIILLDWSCRESLHTLEWLNRQDVPRSDYELIWIDLYDRVPQEALAQADVVVTLNQKGLYHKHVGYNVGLLLARGDVITICDSDAVFPQDFVRSILTSFYEPGTEKRRSLVLMHDELRTSKTYPEALADAEELKDQKRWQWWDVTPNAGACMSVLRDDALRFGGFDECSSYRGYLCGPYDLGWRLVNAGMPEIWHDHSTVIWHFAHPDPVGVNGFSPSVRRLFENSYPHVDLHALTAVEHFSTGRLLPIRENPEIHSLRMARRKIGTRFEERYSNITGPRGFRRWQSTLLRMMLLAELVRSAIRLQARDALSKLIGKPAVDRIYRWLFACDATGPVVVGKAVTHNIVRYQGAYYGVPRSAGEVDFNDRRQLQQRVYFSSQSRILLTLRIWQMEIVQGILRQLRFRKRGSGRLHDDGRRREIGRPFSKGQPVVSVELFAHLTSGDGPLATSLPLSQQHENRAGLVQEFLEESFQPARRPPACPSLPQP
jgi:glycosyltransferase involved in cell wall biosynthesis